MVDNNQKDAQTANGKSETAGATPAAGVSSPRGLDDAQSSLAGGRRRTSTRSWRTGLW